MKSININKQLRRNFIFITMLSIAFITIVSNISITFLFSNYIKETRQRDDLKVVGYIEEVYDDHGEFNGQALMTILHYAFSESVNVRIRNRHNEIIWNSGTSDMMPGIEDNGFSESSLAYKSYTMNYHGNQIGSIDVGRPKSVISSIEDRQFISTINIIFAIAFIFSFILAMLSSSSISQKFLKPIHKIIHNVRLIENGKYKQIEEVKTETLELHELSVTIQELSERLNSQELLRRRMTSDMSHELRTPLTTLQSHIEAFLDGIWEPSTKRLTVVYDEIIRLTNLIKELSDLSIIESDEIKPKKVSLNISTLLKEIIESFLPLLMNKKITLNTNIKENAYILADSDHIKRIFVNILSNAYKYTNESGTITVSLERIDNRIQIIIFDTGIGIPKKDLKHVFERFYRSDLSRGRGTGGTGIGLTITKTLVEANDGEIIIESTEGVGTKVIFWFPLVTSP